MSTDPTRFDTANMADVYNAGADAFHDQAPKLLSWEATGKPAMVGALVPEIEKIGADVVTVADFGCASGRIERDVLLPLGVQAANIHGYEISPDQVALAQADPELEGITFDVADITQELPGDPRDEFDIAVQHMVAEHLDDKQLVEASQRILAALKAGGMFVMICTHPDRVLHTEADKLAASADGRSFDTTFPWGGQGRNYYREVEGYVQALRDAGFEIESVASLPIPEDSRETNPAQYDNYAAQGYFDKDGTGTPLDVRLVVTARKPEQAA